MESTSYHNLPVECVNLSDKLEILSTVILVRDLSCEQASSIRETLHSEINVIKDLVKASQDDLTSVKKDLAVAKETVLMLEKWDENLNKLNSVLPALSKAPVVNGAVQQLQARKSASDPNGPNTNGSGIPTFRYMDETLWKTVPSYLKNRLKLEQVNDFVDSLNKELSQKYTLLKRKTSTLKKDQLVQRVKYLSMETAETKGFFFVVASDLKKQGISEKMLSNMSAILRHCRLMREQRGGQMLRFIVMN